MGISESVGEWFEIQTAAVAMAELTHEPGHQQTEEVILGQAVASIIQATLSHPEWAHQLARTIDNEVPGVSTAAWARRFANAFRAP